MPTVFSKYDNETEVIVQQSMNSFVQYADWIGDAVDLGDEGNKYNSVALLAYSNESEQDSPSIHIGMSADNSNYFYYNEKAETVYADNQHHIVYYFVNVPTRYVRFRATSSSDIGLKYQIIKYNSLTN